MEKLIPSEFEKVKDFLELEENPTDMIPPVIPLEPVEEIPF